MADVETTDKDKRLKISMLRVVFIFFSRITFIRDYTLKSLRLKQDKWNKLLISDEQRNTLINFVEKGIQQVLVISQNIGGQLQIHTDWPSYLRNKGIFFVKRENEGIPELDDEDDDPPDLLDHLTCGDIYPNVLGKFYIYNVFFVFFKFNFRSFLCLG